MTSTDPSAVVAPPPDRSMVALLPSYCSMATMLQPAGLLAAAGWGPGRRP